MSHRVYDTVDTIAIDYWANEIGISVCQLSQAINPTKKVYKDASHPVPDRFHNGLCRL